ncbi:MAG: type III-B CRISPR module RAMP protein Cmr6 [Saprospiraceae bacterium]
MSDKTKEEKNEIDRINEQNAANFKIVTLQFLNTKLKGIYPYRCIKINENIHLRTVYPGLLTGSGYSHETGIKNEFKLGFFFDHTTGLPIIPGSSVKGVLRSAFPSYHLKEEKKANQDARAEFIIRIINKNSEGLYNLSESDKIFVHSLELAVFEGVDINATLQKKTRETDTFAWLKNKDNWLYTSTYHRDIFFDAILEKSDHHQTKEDGNLFGSDFVTPHINREKPELSPYTNPVPIMFLKILPNVTFIFQLFLCNSKLGDNEFLAVSKSDLFRQILLTIGIGAKTNVGYGQFEEPPQPREFTVGEEVEAIVANIDRTSGNRVIFQIKGHTDLTRQVSQKELDFLIIGETVKLKIIELTAMKSIKRYDLMPPIPQKPRKR